ncbi:hypothetical protein [Burkholderia sp. Nafp2/4-1b]|uniref:hypothetical protein n=1 Tax=Burkholderia sp. Nafp2/4-1b TaxID=2116686 RepID=UPI0013CEF360|nr:hypothetical protein [Burkholderia sp. Nafp2/4-1b]
MLSVLPNAMSVGWDKREVSERFAKSCRAFARSAQLVPWRSRSPQTLPDALRLALNRVQKCARFESDVRATVQKVEVLDSLTYAGAAMCITDVAETKDSVELTQR